MVDMVKFLGAKRSSRCRKWGAKPRRIPTDSQRGSAPPPPRVTYIDDDDNFECILFKMSPGLNELTNLSGKALYILLTLTWDTFMEFPLTGSQLINPGLEFFCSKINCPLSRHSLCSALANVPHRLFPCLYAPFVRLYIVDQTQGSSASKRTAP